MIVREIDPELDMQEWLRMRALLYEDTPEDNLNETQAILDEYEIWGVFVLERPSSKLGGFAEVGIRKYAEGCSTSPVAYLEGWYVDADCRKQGFGALLITAVEQWAKQNGYTELASDALIENTVSLAAHLALGFDEVERQICFIKTL